MKARSQSSQARQMMSDSLPTFRIRESKILHHILFTRPHVRLLILTLSLAAALAGLVAPFFQKIFVDRLLGAPESFHWSWVASLPTLGALFFAFLGLVLQQLLNISAIYIGAREATRVQRELSELLYNKMLGRRVDNSSGHTVGEIVSIYATDILGATALIEQTLPVGAGIFFPLILGPLAIYWLYDVPLWGSALVTLLVCGVTLVLALRQARFFYRFKQLAGERTGMVSEWIQNIRTLRILGWVEAFEEKITRKRIEETDNRVAMVTNGQFMSSIGSSISFFVNLSGVYALVRLRGGQITPGEILAFLWILGVFLARPFRSIPWVFTFCMDAITSLRRLEGFLGRDVRVRPESPPKVVPLPMTERGCELVVRNMRLAIGGQELLKGLTFEIKPGEFVAVVGEVGSGKSLLALALMGEVGATFDRYTLGTWDALDMDHELRRGFFSYVPQEGFVMSASLRENVVFEYDTGLAHDERITGNLALAQFSLHGENVADGLATEIGERGVNLSGGQRQRVNLARAAHFERPVIILDDSLSAVDVDTEKRLVADLLTGTWNQKTRILITHRLSVLTEVDRVFFLREGEILDDGPFAGLMNRSEAFRAFVASVVQAEGEKKLKDEEGSVNGDADPLHG